MRVALYTRVSTKGPKNGRTQTPENQSRMLREFARTMNWDVVATFEDRESGAKARPQFTAMMDAAARREFDGVLVWSLDRFSREGIGKTCDHLRKLASYKVAFRSFSEPFLDSSGPFAELVTAIFSFFASFERQRTIERITAGLARARAEGKQLGRPRVIVNRDKIRQLHAEGLSHAKIAAKLKTSRGTVQRACKAA